MKSRNIGRITSYNVCYTKVLRGLRPFFAVYSSFMQRCLDQLIHDVCLPNLPVTIALDRSGVVGARNNFV